MDKKYQSKIDYSKSTFQINKELHSKVKDFCRDNNIKVREFLESIIEEKLYKNF
jgi:hypothetical protein